MAHDGAKERARATLQILLEFVEQAHALRDPAGLRGRHRLATDAHEASELRLELGLRQP
jgi:hypothetical protein